MTSSIIFLLLTVHVLLYSRIDAILDQSITPNSAQYIVWATGPRGAVDGFAYYHTRRTPNFQTTLQFGRTPANNCAALACPTQPSCPFAQQTFDVRNMNATFVAEIGESGGPRGYEGITGIVMTISHASTREHQRCLGQCVRCSQVDNVV